MFRALHQVLFFLWILISTYTNYLSLATFTLVVFSPANSKSSAPGFSTSSSTSVSGTTLWKTWSSHTTAPSKMSPPFPTTSSDLQNRLGDLTKEGPRPCCGPWRLHLPEPEPERAFAKPINVTRSADEHVFLWVEEGVEEGDVLPPHGAGGAGYSVPWYTCYPFISVAVQYAHTGFEVYGYRH